MAYRKKDEDEALSRADYGGSYWDQKYMTDGELRDAYDVRRAAGRGEVTWDDAHDYVENTRARYGYSGGKHGDAYVKTDDKPVMPDDYGAAYREAVRRYTDMAPFSYDHRADPRWQAYKKEYAREGARATEDTLGQYAAMTGGMPSTAAVTAAGQAGDYYAAKLADKVPELYDLAYAMYTGEADRLYRQLSALQAARGGELDRYRTQLNQWNADRDRADALDRQTWERAYRERAYADSRADAEYDRALSEEARAKPAFTAAQVMELIKNPTYASAPNVRAAYEYYFGQPYEGMAGSGWQPGSEDGGTKQYNVTPNSIRQGMLNIVRNGNGSDEAYFDAANYAYGYINSLEKGEAEKLVAEVIGDKIDTVLAMREKEDEELMVCRT